MSNLVVIGFDDEHKTFELRAELAKLQKEYLHLLADLEKTKKRLARTSAQEVEAEKEQLLRDVLPVADGLGLALLHASSDEDNRDILQDT